MHHFLQNWGLFIWTSVKACYPCESVVPWSVSHTMGFPHPNDLKYAARCFSNSQDFPGSFFNLSCSVVNYNLSYSLQKLKDVLKFKSSNVWIVPKSTEIFLCIQFLSGWEDLAGETENTFIAYLWICPKYNIWEILRINICCKNVVQISFCFSGRFLFSGAVQNHLSFWRTVCIRSKLLAKLSLSIIIDEAKLNVKMIGDIFIFVFDETLCCSNPVFPCFFQPSISHICQTLWFNQIVKYNAFDVEFEGCIFPVSSFIHSILGALLFQNILWWGHLYSKSIFQYNSFWYSFNWSLTYWMLALNDPKEEIVL